MISRTDIYNLFKVRVKVKGCLISFRLVDIPSKETIYEELRNHVIKNPVLIKYFQENFNLINKESVIKNLNYDTTTIVKSYFFDCTEDIYKYIYRNIFDNYEIKINEVVAECRQDMSIFQPDTIEFQTAYILIENCERFRCYINKIFNNIYLNL